MSVAAIIVAAGSSIRMGFDKLTADLLGKPVLLYSVEAFLQCPEVDHIILVTSEDRFDLITNAVSGRTIVRVDGGKTRQSSVEAGIRSLPDEVTLVAIHDGARPLIRPADISKCLAAAKQYGAATLARSVTETLKRADLEGFTRTPIDRNDLYFMETPQCFRANILRRAYNHVKERRITVTDEVSAIESIGVNSKIIETSAPNIKITHPGDIRIVAALMTS